MRFGLFLLILSTVPAVLGQAPVTVVNAGWKVDRQPAPRPETQYIGPQKEITPDDKYWSRKTRENQVRGSAPDPGEMSLDGRRAALDKINQEARTPKPTDIDGYTYKASFKNDTQKQIRIIYWEYRFTERSNPANSVRRQFLCSASVKPGDKTDVAVFSTLGPSEAISLQSLAKDAESPFDEKIFINRIEFNDGSVLNRGGWKFEENKKAIDHITSTPWGKETCRAF
jgi:hypothetical protein